MNSSLFQVTLETLGKKKAWTTLAQTLSDHNVQLELQCKRTLIFNVTDQPIASQFLMDAPCH